MNRIIVFFTLVAVTMQSGALQMSWATDCSNSAYGVSTLSSDAQCPPGGCTGFGVIEITPPDEYVYGVSDGSLIPQQFLFIKTKLRNLLTRDIRSGKLWASARYRKRTDYQPDLSADPPSPENSEDHFNGSLSVPIEIDELSSDSPKTYFFDFSGDPIPAGITDLYLIITFIGEIEGLEGPNAAIGIKDLNEPMHLTYWNMRNYLVYNETAREIESLTSEELSDAYERCDFYNYLQLTGHYYAGFSPAAASPLTPVAFIGPFIPGQHSRLIVLAQPGPMRVRTYYPNDHELDFNDWKYDDPEYCQRSYNNCNYGDTIYGGVVNQQHVDGFIATDPIIFRTIKSHFPDYNYLSCPPNYDSDGVQMVRELYKELPAGDPVPVSLEILDLP